MKKFFSTYYGRIIIYIILVLLVSCVIPDNIVDEKIKGISFSAVIKVSSIITYSLYELFCSRLHKKVRIYSMIIFVLLTGTDYGVLYCGMILSVLLLCGGVDGSVIYLALIVGCLFSAILSCIIINFINSIIIRRERKIILHD